MPKVSVKALKQMIEKLQLQLSAEKLKTVDDKINDAIETRLNELTERIENLESRLDDHAL